MKDAAPSDINRTTQKFEINYPVNTYQRTVELGSNNTWYYGRAVSGTEYFWCMMFIDWASLPVLKTASYTALANWTQQQKRALRLITDAWRPPYPDDKEEHDMNCYHCVKDIPEAFQAPILLLVEMGIPTGYGNAGSNPKNLVVDLSHDMLRTPLSAITAP